MSKYHGKTLKPQNPFWDDPYMSKGGVHQPSKASMRREAQREIDEALSDNTETDDLENM